MFSVDVDATFCECNIRAIAPTDIVRFGGEFRVFYSKDLQMAENDLLMRRRDRKYCIAVFTHCGDL